MFDSIEDVEKALAEQRYFAGRAIATTVFLSAKLGKPLFLEGEAGVGKTELSKVLAATLGADLIRLQCYEGLDEAKAIYEWKYGKQLLYTQVLKETLDEVLQGAKGFAIGVDGTTGGKPGDPAGTGGPRQDWR